MPLELGIFLGARHFGRPLQRRKVCLILDRDRYRYQIFCSDIAGQDIRAHGNEVARAVVAVRDWLHTHLPSRVRLPGPGTIADRYVDFQFALPYMGREAGLNVAKMSFLDYRRLVESWITINPQ